MEVIKEEVNRNCINYLNFAKEIIYNILPLNKESSDFLRLCLILSMKEPIFVNKIKKSAILMEELKRQSELNEALQVQSHNLNF